MRMVIGDFYVDKELLLLKKTLILIETLKTLQWTKELRSKEGWPLAQLNLEIMKLAIYYAVFLGILLACNKQDEISGLIDVQEEKKQKLEQFFIKLDEATNKGDKSAYVNLFTPDATMFLPNRLPLIGRDAISDWSEKFNNKVTLITDTYEQENIDIVGDIAIVRSRGTGFYVINATQERIPLRNKFIDVLKYKDGEWLFMYHLASSFSFEPGLWNRDWENQQEDTTQD